MDGKPGSDAKPPQKRRPKGERPTRPDAGTPRCGANLTKGDGTCANGAGAGTGHRGVGYCVYHGGKTRSHQAKARREIIQRVVAGMGIPIETTPEQALMSEVYRSAGHVQWMSDVIADWEYNAPRELILQLGETGYEKAAWIRVYQDERAHLARVAKAAIDAGIAERVVQLATTQAGLINQAITQILTDLGQDPRDPQVRRVVANRLSAVAALTA